MGTLDRGVWSRRDGSQSPAQALYTASSQRPQPDGAAATCPPARGQVRPAVVQVRQLHGQAAAVPFRPLPPPGRCWAQRPGRGRRLAAARKHKPRGRGSEGRCAPAPERKLKVRKEPGCRRGGAEGRMVGRGRAEGGGWGGPSGVFSPRSLAGPPQRSGAQTGLLGSHLEGPPGASSPACQAAHRACTWVVIHGKSSSEVEQLWGLGDPPEVPSPRGLLVPGSVWAPPVQHALLPPQVLMASPQPARSTGSSPTDSPDLPPGSWTSESLQWLLVCLHFSPDHTAPHQSAPHHRPPEPCWSWDTCPFFEWLGQVKAAR